MTPEEFRRAVDRGMGRAVQCLMDRDPSPYVPELIAACVRNGRWHFQEENRAPYLARLATLANAEDDVLSGVLAAIPSADNWDFQQLAWLLPEFTKKGHVRAKSALLSRALVENGEISSLVSLGAPALKWLLQVRPELFTSEHIDDVWYWISVAEEASGKEAVAAILTDTARETMQAWNDRVEAPEKSDLPPLFTLEELKQFVRDPSNKSRRYAATLQFGREAPTEERRRVAEQVLTAKAATVWALRGVFKSHGWPLDPDSIISRIDCEDRAANAFREFLSQITHPRVRELALDRLRQDSPDRHAVRFLLRNYVEGDEAEIFDALIRAQDPDENVLHTLLLDTRRLAEEVEVPRFLPHLELAIERGPCSYCRAQVFGLLHKSGLLSDAYRTEAAFDAEPEAREVALGLR